MVVVVEQGEQEKADEEKLEISHNLDEYEQAARAAAARPGIVGRITDVIDRLVAAGRPIGDKKQQRA